MCVRLTRHIEVGSVVPGRVKVGVYLLTFGLVIPCLCAALRLYQSPYYGLYILLWDSPTLDTSLLQDLVHQNQQRTLTAKNFLENRTSTYLSVSGGSRPRVGGFAPSYAGCVGPIYLNKSGVDPGGERYPFRQEGLVTGSIPKTRPPQPHKIGQVLSFSVQHRSLLLGN
jgi:hypothetical protein